jgi:hypothetical protein
VTCWMNAHAVKVLATSLMTTRTHANGAGVAEWSQVCTATPEPRTETTVSEIPDAAIEAAAEAWYLEDANAFMGDDGYPDWLSDENAARGVYREYARAAIEAAMPAIREHFAQKIEAAIEPAMPIYSVGVTEAARIVRGGAA